MNRRRPRLAAGALALAAALACFEKARAEPGAEAGGGGSGPALQEVLSRTRITGWARFDYFQASNSLDGDKSLAGASLQIKALPRLNDLVDAKFEARLSAPDVEGRDGHKPDAQLLEGYVVLHLPDADLRLGKQIAAWGRADGINPTDNLTPRNYTILLPNDEDQRFGIWAARLNVSLSEAMTLTLFASPDFQPDRFPLPTTGLKVVGRRPDHTAGNLVTGVKLDKSSGAFDWSLSYFHGPSLLPTVQSVGEAVDLNYERADVLGADMARNFGRFGFRSELAYTFASHSGSADPNAGRSRLFWIAGVDRTFLENLNLNVQLLMRWAPDRIDPASLADPSARAASTLNALIRGQEADVGPGLSFRVSDQWRNNTLKAELFGVLGATRGDFYLRPLLTYDLSDQVRLSVGANLYAGPALTPYGVLKPDTGAFIELRRGF